MNDPENATPITEDMVHDQLVLLQEARMNLTVARMAAWMAKRDFCRLGAILFSEETKIPIVTLRDVQFVHEWGPRFGWTGVPFYPVPNNINVVGNLPEDVIGQHCFVLGLILWGQGGKQEEMIHRAHNRLQQFENAWESYDNAAQAILQPKTVYDHAAFALVKATIIPVVNQNQLELCRVLRDKFAWFGNAKFPGSPNILQFYGVLTPAEAREDEEEVTRLAANMHFDAYVRR